MRNKIYILVVLVALASMTAVSSAYAQRAGRGGGGHGGFGGGFGGGRVSSGSFGGGRAFSSGVTRSPGFSGRAYGGNYRGGSYYRGGNYYRGGGYYHGGGYYGRGYYYRPYRYYGAPIGFLFGALPFGYLTFNTAWGPYYYNDGFFYQQYANNQTQTMQYQVVDPPMGVVVPSLPSGANPVVVDGNTYYEKNGTYYQQVMKDNEPRYVVVGKNGQLDTGNGDSQEVAPPVDQVITTLPDGSRSVEINGQQMYVSPDGMYYQEVTNADNSRGYKIVGKTSADN